MQKKPISDQELVGSYLKGNEHAFAELVHRHKSRVYTAIHLFVKDRYLAEDIFQETFIKAVNKIRKGLYTDEGKFAAWLLRIAHNLCIDHYRKTKRTPKVVTTEGFDIFNVLPFHENNAQTRIIKEEEHGKVREVLEQLPAEQREVVILRHYADLSFKEISEITGVSINTALGRMRYALINMRRLMTETQNAEVRVQSL
jgi:RNA polymerase sigma factor (sigma-70 family)